MTEPVHQQTPVSERCPMCVIYRRDNPDPEDADRLINPGWTKLGLCGDHSMEVYQLWYDQIEASGIRDREEYQ